MARGFDSHTDRDVEAREPDLRADEVDVERVGQRVIGNSAFSLKNLQSASEKPLALILSAKVILSWERVVTMMVDGRMQRRQIRPTS